MKHNVRQQIKRIICLCLSLVIAMCAVTFTHSATVHAEENSGYTGLVFNEGNWYYMVNGLIDSSYNGLYNDAQLGWWYVKDGVVDFSYNGLTYYNSDWWTVANGALDFNTNGLFYDSQLGWYYTRNGRVDYTKSGLVFFNGGWWAVSAGRALTDYTGLWNDSELGWWYVRSGMVDFGYSGLIELCGSWWCVANGKVVNDYTGLWSDPNVGWWYVKDGVIDFSRNGLEFYNGAWWCIYNGKVAFEYTGLWSDDSLGWWYVKNGAVDFSRTGFESLGDELWCVSNGRVRNEYSGLWKDDVLGTYYVGNGLVYKNYTGSALKYIEDSEDGTQMDEDTILDNMCFLTDGVVDTEFTGVWDDTSLGLGYLYFENGKVSKEYSGFAEFNNKTVYIQNGRFNSNLTDKLFDSNTNTYVYVKNGEPTTWDNYIADDLRAARDSNPDYKYESDSVNIYIKHQNIDGRPYWIAQVFAENPNKVGTAMANGGIGNGRQKATDFSNSTGAIFAVNASGFSWETSLPQGDAPIVENGVVLRDGRVVNMGAYTYHGEFLTPSPWIYEKELMEKYDVKGTFVFGPTLIADGKPEDIPTDAYKSTSNYGRSIVGMVKPGEYVFLVTDKTSSSQGITLFEARDIMQSYNCKYAYNLDGGGSATMVFDGKLINSPSDGSERAVVQFIYVMP